jgi:hypothetical protein
VVRVAEQSEPCKHGEPYVPTNVNLVLGNPDVAFRGPWDKTNIIKVAPAAHDLSKGPVRLSPRLPRFRRGARLHV